MTFRYLDIELRVRTVTRHASYRANFTPGLNVIQAANTWGKSTLVQSLVFGLGLEGAFSTSHLSPLGEAMTSVIDLDGQREAVVESSALVTIQNDAGEALRVRRFAKSLEYSSDLVQTWLASDPNHLSSAPKRDYFVRQSGGATHELGFHRLLEEFADLNLPTVPGFNADEVKLYLEVIFPLFYVEQKYGWSGLAPRVPTQFRIRSPYRRAAEFVLGLGTLKRLKTREALSARLTKAKTEWAESSGELRQIVLNQGWELATSLPDLAEPGLIGAESPFGVRRDGSWRTVEADLDEMRARSAELETAQLRTVGEGIDAAREELASVEHEVARLSGRYRALTERLAATESEIGALDARQAELRHSRETLLDVRKLERLGSDIDAISLASAHCPTCAQALDSAHVVSGIVMDVTANLGLLDAEKTTLTRILDTAKHKARAQRATLGALRDSLDERRQRVRTLKSELTSSTDSPSVAQIEARLELRDRLRNAETALAHAYSLLDIVNSRASAIIELQSQIRALRNDEGDARDRDIVRRFTQRFTQALRRFGLSSLPVDEITISNDSLLPEHDGFELAFDIRHGLSASDAIRTKWAHYVAMASTAATEETGNPLGVLILDEPRQQEANFESVRALYAELGDTATNTQVIVASSASREEMTRLIAGVNARLIENSGTHMFSGNSSG